MTYMPALSNFDAPIDERLFDRATRQQLAALKPYSQGTLPAPERADKVERLLQADASGAIENMQLDAEELAFAIAIIDLNLPEELGTQAVLEHAKRTALKQSSENHAATA